MKTLQEFLYESIKPGVSTNYRKTYIPKSERNDMITANNTSRKSGAIGDKALVPRAVKSRAKSSDSILDFGAGKHATHANNLRTAGYNVTAHEFGNNINDNHDRKALSKKYDHVYASNVLNTQSSPRMLDRTLNNIHRSAKDKFTTNLPLEPRKSEYLTPNNVKSHIGKFFKNVETPNTVDGSKIPKTKPVYFADNPVQKIKAKRKYD